VAVERAVFIAGPRLSRAGTLLTYSALSGVSEVSYVLQIKSKTGGAGNGDFAGAGRLYCFVTTTKKKVTL